MHSIASEYLYDRIICNDVPALLYAAIELRRNPAILPGRKIQLLSHCRYLHLEPPHTLLSDSTLRQIRGKTKAALKCIKELNALFRAMKMLGGLRRFFPLLETLSAGAYTSIVPAVYEDQWNTSKSIRHLYRAWETLYLGADLPVRCTSIGRSYPFRGHQTHPVVYEEAGWGEPHSVAIDRPSYTDERPNSRPNVHYVHSDTGRSPCIATTDLRVVYLLGFPTF